MTRTNGSYFVGAHINGTSNGTYSDLLNPTNGAPIPSLSTTASRGLPSATGTLHPTTPATPSNGDLSAGSGSNSLSDREERAVAALLTRFKTLITLAAEPVEDGATKEMAAAHGLQMEVEGSALVRFYSVGLQLLKRYWS